MTWIIMPVMAAPEMTEAAISDCLAQSVPTRLLIINQGVETAFRERLERIAEEHADRVFLWSHDPPLPSLAASWNRALDFVWQTGGTEALVVNNDVRLHAGTVDWLNKVLQREQALFVSCVGVTKEQFDPAVTYDHYAFWDAHSDEPSRAGQLLHKGGPDFSCFLIAKSCHAQYRFDEAFIPAYCEDLDYHRRLMLGGDGSKIFSVNLPYLHFAAQTLKTIDPKRKSSIEARIVNGSRAHYRAKWGGDVNQETFYTPFNEGQPTLKPGFPGDLPVTTPALQAWLRESSVASPNVIAETEV